MSVIDRLNRLVRANLNDLMNRSSEQRVYSEVRNSLREARAQLVECRVTKKRLVQEYESYLDEATSWEERAMLALRSNDEPLARKALYRKQEADQKGREVKDRLDEHHAYMTDLSRSLDAMEIKLEGLRERTRIERSLQSPSIPPYPGEQRGFPRVPQVASWEAEAEFGTFGLDEQMHQMDEMAHRIDREEAEVEALNELAPLPRDDFAPPLEDDVEESFRDLELDRDMERLSQRGDSLTDLRRRLLDEE